jgi:CheY-specific phosphatase CheX
MSIPLIEAVRAAFFDAAVRTFGKMTMTPIDALDKAQAGPQEFEISAVIGFSGDITGNCALRLSEQTAREALSRLAGEPVHEAVDVADGVGELVNMIAGNAKAALVDYTLTLSFPQIIRGKGHELSFNRKNGLVDLLFSSDIGAIAVLAAFTEKG